MYTSIGRADPAHSRTEYHITVADTGEVIIRNVRVLTATQSTGAGQHPQ